MTTKTKKSSKNAKAKKVEKEMLIVDFCPAHLLDDMAREHDRLMRDLDRESISFWTAPKAKAEAKPTMLQKVSKWFKGLFKRK